MNGRLLTSALLAATALSAPLAAQTTQWSAGTGSWFTAGNWSAGVPTSGTIETTVNNGGTAQIGAGAANAGAALVIGGGVVSVGAGGSLAAGSITIGNGALETASSAISSPITLGQNGRIAATGNAALTGPVTLTGTNNFLQAANGQTLKLQGVVTILPGTSAVFGGVGQTGTVELAPVGVGGNSTSFEMTVAAGTLAITNSLGNFLTTSSSNILVASGARLTFPTLSVASINRLQGSGEVQAGGPLFISEGDFGGTISADGLVVRPLSPIRQSVLTLSGANTYKNFTEIQSFIVTTVAPTTLTVSADSNLGDPAAAIVFQGGALRFAQDFASARDIRILSQTPVYQGGGILDAGGHQVTLSGEITGAGGLFNIGAGTLTLSGPNTYTGGTSINAGSIRITHGSALGPGTVFLRGGALRSAASLAFTNDVNLQANTAGIVAAAGGTTLTFKSRLFLNANSALVFGDGLDSGTIEFAADIGSTKNPAIVVSAGTLRPILQGAVGFNLLAIAAPSFTVATGATLDLSVLGGGIGNLLGGGTVSSNGPLVIEKGNFTGTITGTGALQKTGSGTFFLGGLNAMTSTSVLQGEFQVQSSGTMTGAVSVNPGATLGGTGTVGPTSISGTLSPGSSIGTLTVNKSLTLDSGATLRVEVAPGSADRVNVLGAPGTASLAGTLRVVPVADSGFTVGERSTIVAASGGVSGTFGTTVNANPYFTFAPVYNPTTVEIEFKGFNPGAMQAIGQIPNGQAVGSVLDRLFASAPNNPIVQSAIAMSTSGALAPALASVAGEIGAAAAEPGLRQGRAFVGVLSGQAARGRAAAAESQLAQHVQVASVLPIPVAISGRSQWSAWASGLGGGGAIESATASRTSYSAAGGATGIDYRSSGGWLFGLGGGFSAGRFSLSDGGSSGRSRMLFGGAYAGFAHGAFYADAAALYGHADMRTERTTTLGAPERARAGFSGHLWGGQFEAGYRLRFGAVDLAPLAGVTALRLGTEAYTEDATVIATGTGGTLGLRYAGRGDVSVRSVAGAQFSTRLRLGDEAVASIRARAAWAHEFETSRRARASLVALPGTGFSVSAAEPARDAALLSGGVDLLLGRGVGLFAAADGELSARGHAYAGTGGVRLSW